ncbi:variant erythrocyte surface antigen-1, alpha subunit [Babesia caballi]|uniref:Variant erythrocyte surface antigen-1, alpha subunit n=1 Tax=Babesia caballi TaxID=5871 RepID=A0AAV4LZX6_BABCB|nr:variant erythrocyte surface antigen-1, alpha subunit [Babesia caballi]
MPDWILRVTGKDGQGGQDNTAALARAVTDILQSAISEVNTMRGNGSVKGADLDKLREGLQKAKDLIGKDVKPLGFGSSYGSLARLSDGLAKFIGYKNFRDSYLERDDWKITGAGIAPSNMATRP